MKINCFEILRNAKRLEKAGFDTKMIALIWLNDTDNTDWLIKHKSLYDHNIYYLSMDTNKIAPPMKELIMIRIEDIDYELEAFRVLGPPPGGDIFKDFLDESRLLLLEELNKLS